MRPRGKLFALVAVFAAIGLVTATGAFTTVSAQRTATVNTAGDANALLAMQPANTLNGQAYASNKSGTLKINLGSGTGNGNAEGVNKNATTVINNVFNITNQGTQTVAISITPNGANPSAVTFYNGTVGSGANITGSNTATLTSGGSLSVSMKIDTHGLSNSGTSKLINSITVNANKTSA